MATNLIGAEDLNSVIEEILLDYAEYANEEVKKAAKKSAQAAVKRLKASSPTGAGSKKGHYKEGWSIEEQKSRYATGFTIHNKKKPGLAHLLEYGHAKRGGGRVEGKPHIAPAEKQAVKEFEEELRRRLGE